MVVQEKLVLWWIYFLDIFSISTCSLQLETVSAAFPTRRESEIKAVPVAVFGPQRSVL